MSTEIGVAVFRQLGTSEVLQTHCGQGWPFSGKRCAVTYGVPKWVEAGSHSHVPPVILNLGG